MSDLRDRHGRFTRPGEIVAIEHMRARQASAAMRMGLTPHPPAQNTSEPGSKPGLDGGLKRPAPTGQPQTNTEHARRDLAQARAEGVPMADALGAFLQRITRQ
jgi:hypothetical protein